MKKMTNFLICFLILLLSLTLYYRRPFVRYLGNRGMVIVHHVKHRTELKADYIVITKIDNDITVEIIHGPGPENVLTLKGKDALQYLSDAGIHYGG